jgi:hypothetical protein
MAALTKEFVTSERRITRDLRPMAAGAKVFKGGLVVAKSGFYKAGITETGARCVGYAAESVDNTGGSAGAKNLDVHFGTERFVRRFANSGTNAVTAAMRETLCYLEDDNTVGSSSSGTSVAGLVYDVTAEGVWVDMGVKS